MDSTHITEIMPPDMPDWMWDAIEEGLLARRSMEKVADLDGIASRLVAVNLELRERITELESRLKKLHDEAVDRREELEMGDG